MQTAGDLVSSAAELAARVQFGQNDLYRGHALFGVNVDRYASAVIGDGDRTFARDLHGDGVAVTRQRFVDRVVDYLDDKVVKSSLVRRADIHTGAFADGFQSFEYLNFA